MLTTPSCSIPQFWVGGYPIPVDCSARLAFLQCPVVVHETIVYCSFAGAVVGPVNMSPWSSPGGRLSLVAASLVSSTFASVSVPVSVLSPGYALTPSFGVGSLLDVCGRVNRYPVRYEPMLNPET
ncbi:unnamed protein product [Protopolystoma xenopodis]|uniref:Uncharacterized protein n=1 Tax=Protopolystoma xenopodis TaxID=117903 RepID=A0A448WNW2_9PLAT|nr:unnamed protein product [Protopolystoma xenopodis]